MLASSISSCTDGYGETGSHTQPNGDPLVIDIRQDVKAADLKLDIVNGLRSDPKFLPSFLLWNTEGLRLFDKVTQSRDYYPKSAEIEILNSHGDDLVTNIMPGSVVIELGSGNLKKTLMFLKAIARQKKHVYYYALDLSESELRRGLSNLALEMGCCPYIRCKGLVGSYDDVALWMQHNPSVSSKPTFYLWMGNSIANHPVREAISVLAMLSVIPGSRGPKPSFLVAVDHCRDKSIIERGYNIKLGESRNFILNGLSSVNTLVQEEIFREGDWEFKGEYHEQDHCYRSFYVAKKDIVVHFSGEDFQVARGETVHAINSWKWDVERFKYICENASLKCGSAWHHERLGYGMYLLEPLEKSSTCG